MSNHKRLPIRTALAAPILAAVLASATAALMPIGSPAAAASAKKASVYPDHGVVDGQPIIVRWSGFPKGEPVALRLCRTGATDVADCAKYAVSGDRLSDVVSSYAATDGRGEGSENLIVAVTDDNHGLAGAPHVRCDSNNPCDVVVTNSFTALDGGVRATIKFAPVRECPEPGDMKLQVGGSDAAELAMNAWAASVCQTPYDVSLGFISKNDVSGRLDYQCQKLDAAVVEYRPDYADDSCPPTTPGGKETKRTPVRLAPMTLSPVVIGFNMRNQSPTDNSHIDHLVLTPELLAEIFTGRLYTGQDKRIKALNPGVTLPVNIKAIARADQAAINYTLTRFLHEYAPKEYAAGGRLFQSGPTDFLANVNGLDLKTGGTAVAKAVLYPENDPRTTAWGYFGVMDASQAARYGLSTVTIKLGSGARSRLVNPTEAATIRALSGVKPDRYGYFDIPARPADPLAWPMVSVGYLMPPSAEGEPLRLAATLTAAKFILDPTKGQSRSTLPAGYVPLTQDLVEQARTSLSFAVPDPLPSTSPAGPSTSPVPSVAPSVSASFEDPAIPTPAATAVGEIRTDEVELASVFDRGLNGSSSSGWLWVALMAGAALAMTYLVKTTKGATR